MSIAEDAYKEAQRRIAADLGVIRLDLSIEGLEVIPPEITNLTNLTELFLTNTQITSAEPLSGLTNLTLLSLENTPITSAEPLSGLTNLTVLDLDKTHISLVEPLSDLTNLTALYLDDSQITSTAPLSNLTNLTALYLDNTQITSVEPISGLTNLIKLSLENTRVSDLRPLKNLAALENSSVFDGLHFRNCTATKLDPELKRLSELEDIETSTRDTFAYLKTLTEWPPQAALPDETGDASRYVVPDNGPVTAVGDPLGANDPEQAALQEDCRDKVRTLIASVREGDNELASLVETAQKYRNLIDRNAPDIFVRSLWSAANTLRTRHEANGKAIAQGRANDELPPLTAAALQDLLGTHGLFFLGHPGAAEVERTMRQFLHGPRNPEARDAANEIADLLTDAPTVLDPAAAEPLALDQEAADGEGPSAQMGEVSLLKRTQNIVTAMVRGVWAFSKTKTGLATDTVIAADILNWIAGNKLIIAKFYQAVTTQYPIWLEAIIQTIIKFIS